MNINIIDDNPLSDLLWNPDYIDLFHLDWFPFFAYRMIYSPIHPSISNLSVDDPKFSILDELSFRIKQMEIDTEDFLIQNRLDKLRLLKNMIMMTRDRLALLDRLVKDQNAYIVCQRADYHKLNNMYPEKVGTAFLSSNTKSKNISKIILCRKLKPQDINFDEFPKALNEIIVMSDKRRGKLEKAFLLSVSNHQLLHPTIITPTSDKPTFVKSMDEMFSNVEVRDYLEEAINNYKEQVDSLRASVRDSKQNFANFHSMYYTKPDYGNNRPGGKGIKGDVAYLFLLENGKRVYVPISTRIFIENKTDNEVTEISPSDFLIHEHNLILLDVHKYKYFRGARASIMIEMNENESIDDLYQLNSGNFGSEQTRHYARVADLFRDYSLMTLRLVESASLVGDVELSNRILYLLRLKNIPFYQEDTFSERWNNIEDWIDFGEFEAPVPSISEKTISPQIMIIIFIVVNKIIRETGDPEIDAMRCWNAVNIVQQARRRYIKQRLAKEAISHDVSGLEKVTLEDEIDYLIMYD